MTSRRLDLAVAAIFASLAATFLYKDLAAVRSNVLPGEVMLGRDFVNAWAGGWLTLQRRVGDIYSSHYMASLDQLTGHTLSVHAFSYPPSALLFLWPLGFLPYLAALILFLIATGTAYLTAARPYLARAGLPLWAAALLPAAILNIWAGHYGFLFSALWLATFSAMDRRPLRAGGLIALLTFKPHMGVLIPLLLLLRQRWRVILAAAAGTLALAALSLLLFGGSAWIAYLTGTSKLQMHLLVKEHAFFFAMMPTAYSTVWTASSSLKLAILAQCITALAATVITVRAARSEIAWTELGLMAATATFLVLPYAFNYDMEVIGLAAALLLFDPRRQLDLVGRVLALLALGAPVLVLVLSPHTAPLLPVALLGFLWVQARAYGALDTAAHEPALAA
jgi:alpha-1,2-mannosyltransferase